MRKIQLLILLLVFMVTGLSAREKTEKIGKYTWYTEQNSFAEVVAIAKKTNKPIMAVFSATWCAPCHQVKNSVFKTDEFKKVEDEVILLYIEQTTKEGSAYNKKFKISAFPTFKIFSKDGIMLDTGHPQRTVPGFLQWIKEVKGGNNFYELSKRIKKNPKDREALIKIVDKMGWSEVKGKISNLKKAIQINPDFNDKLSNRAYEKLAYWLSHDLSTQRESQQMAYFEKHRSLFNKILNAYYPHKFKEEMKGNHGLQTIMIWFTIAEKYKKVLFYLNDFLKQKGEAFNLVKDIDVISSSMAALLETNKMAEAEAWIEKGQQKVNENKTLLKSREFMFYYMRLYQVMIDRLSKTGQLKQAEEYARKLSLEFKNTPYARIINYYLTDYAAKYGLLAEDTLNKLEEQRKTAKGQQLTELTCSTAKILAKMGHKAKAKSMLTDLSENKQYLDSLPQKSLANVLNSIAWTMVETKTVDKKSLKIGQKAVQLNDSHMIMDTLACMYAQLDNYKKAIEIEKEAIKKATQDTSKEEYLEKISVWKKKVK